MNPISDTESVLGSASIDETSGMIDSQDISEQELEVLKGDAVGDNLCSSKWIINTLMSLCEIDKNGWTEELEDQLGILWDLSMEEEVVSHLMSYDFPKIAKDALMTSDEPRLIEIILGIIGNVCCNLKAIDTIGRDRELVTQILSYLTSDDSLILIQLLRILLSITWAIRQTPQSVWIAHLTECEFFGDTIIFMLKNSTNDDLVMDAMTLLECISKVHLPHENNFLERLFKIDDFMPALLESFTQVISVGKDSYSERELRFVRRWLTMLIVVSQHGSLRFDKNDENFWKLMDIMYIILKPYKKSYNLFPIRQIIVNVIRDTARMLFSCHRVGVNVPPRIDHIIATICFSLETVPESESRVKTNQEADPEVLIANLFCYLNKYWSQISELCSSEQITEILRLCECEVREYLIKLIQLTASPATFENVRKAAIALEEC